MSINDPRDIPGLLFWYSADYEKTVIADNAAMQNLTDLSGNGRHAVAQGANNTSERPVMRHSGGVGGAPYMDVNASGKGWLIPDYSAAVDATNGCHYFLDIYAYNNGRGPFKAWSSDQYWTFSDGHLYSDFHRSDRVGPIDINEGTMGVITTWRKTEFFSRTGRWFIRIDSAMVPGSPAGGTFDDTTDNAGNTVYYGAWPNAGNPNGYRFGGLYAFDHELTGTELTDFNAWRNANPAGGLQYVPAPPDDPSGLTVLDDTGTSITIDWTPPPGGNPPTGYNYRINGGAPVDMGMTMPFTITGLSSDTTYTIEVQSYNDDGESGWISLSYTTLNTCLIEPIYSDFTEQLYKRIPEAYREADAKHCYQLKKYISGLGDQGGEVDALLERIDYISLEDGGPVGDTSQLADPMLADEAWLPWLSQVLGVRLPPNTTLADKRTLLSDPALSYRAGTKASMKAAASTVLTGSKFVDIYDHTDNALDIGGATEWDVMIVTNNAETPPGADPIQAIIDAGVKPAGVVLHHNTFVTDWDTLETNLPTWNDWNAQDWDGIESAGL